MRVKRFEASSLEEAMRAVKAEFGPDAVVLSSGTAPGTPGNGGARRVAVTAARTEDLGVIRRMMAREQASRATSLAVFPQVRAWRDVFLGAGARAEDVAAAVEAAVAATREGATPEAAFAAALEARWPTRGPVRVAAGRPRIVAVTGRHGEGRTTLARKLAHRAAGVAPGRVFLLDCSPESVSPMRTDPDLPGVELAPAPDPWALGDRLAACQDAFFVVLDLPGFNPLEPATVTAVAERVVVAPGAEVLLAAAATTAPEETLAAVRCLPRGGVSGIALTHLDDATRPGGTVEVGVRAGLPLAFLSGGRSAEMGLELASWSAVLQWIEAVRARVLPAGTANDAGPAADPGEADDLALARAG